MHCPFCNSEETKVIDSRLVSEGFQVRRRRVCASCGERFTTFETAEVIMPRVVKRDGARESFSEEKLRNGILRALEKRPVSTDIMEETVRNITRTLRAGGEKEITADRIGQQVMAALRKIDEVAYIRFASVYRRFRDLHEFREEIDRLEEQTPEQPDNL